jgi:DNA-binding NtrC family response regulator
MVAWENHFARKPKMSKPRVLVVDDEERFRTTLGKMLAAQGLEVEIAGSGEEALEKLKALPCDVVLLDIRMPGMGGIAALSAIKARDPLIEVIALSGHASLDAAMELMQRGAYDYLLKPCALEDVLAKIESAWEKKQEREKIKGKTP